jgi:hypothetical protein
MSDSNAKNDDNTKFSENVTLIETKWTIDHEKIFIEWADKAMCYRWLHSRAHEWFSFMNGLYTIPVIVLSTLTGTANFAQTRVPVDYQNYYAMAVGALNIIAGIISTVQQFLKITQLNEAHRVSSIAWDKFYRNIKIELAKHPDERIQVFQMIKMCKEEFDRLMETSPSIPEYVVVEFKKTFKSVLDTDDNKKMIFQPEICDKLVPTRENINQWNDVSKMIIEINDNEKKTKESEATKLKTLEDNKKLVRDWCNLFLTHNKRRPTEEEILDQLKDKLEATILKSIIREPKKDGTNNV